MDDLRETNHKYGTANGEQREDEEGDVRSTAEKINEVAKHNYLAPPFAAAKLFSLRTFVLLSSNH